MSTAVEDAILLLADNFEQEGNYMHSIRCLRALYTAQKLLPATEVKVRLHLARLLVHNTYDVDKAITELKTALVMVTALPGNLCLRLEVLSLLSRCHRQLGNEKDQRDCLQLGVDVCQQGAHTNERNELILWQVYFQTRLAEVHMSQNDIPGALQWTAAGLQLAAHHELHQPEVLLLLCRFHLHLIEPEGTPAACQTAEQLTHALGRMQSKLEPGETSAFLVQAKLNFNILQVSMQLREGQLHALTPQDGPQLAVINTMQALLQQLEAHPPPYEWLPYSLQNAVIQLLAANIIKHTGKPKQALVHIQMGEKLVDAQLRDLGVNSTTFGTQLPAPVMFKASTPLLLKLLLLECKVQLQLLQTKLEDARLVLWRCIKLLSGYPFLKALMGPAVHVLLGMYTYSVGSFHEAALHCHSALVSWHETGTKNSTMTATCLKILSSVESREPGAVAAGLDALGPESDPDLGFMETALWQLTRSVLKLQQGQVAEAKTLLAKALKSAHRKLCSHHIISNVLNVLAPQQLQDLDYSGAEQMASSSFTLSRNNGDVPGVLNAFKVMHMSHKMQEQDAGKLGSETDYIKRKTEELQGAVKKALENSEQHEAVKSWDLLLL